jgi:periodic tryptophan protein 2
MPLCTFSRYVLIPSYSNKSHTLPFSHRRSITRLALNPRGNLLLSIDSDGHAILTIVPRRIALYHFSLRGSVTALSFAPSGKQFAVAIGRHIEVWHTPSTPEASGDGELEFAPFVRHRTYTGHFDSVTSIEWSSDSRFFLSGSKDLTARIWSLDPEEGFEPTTLAGHRQGVRGAWFSIDQETVGLWSCCGALKAGADSLRADIHREQRRRDLSMEVHGP